MELINDRKSSTMLDLFRERVRPGSVIVTDGYPSYPSAVKNFCSEHEVVNHSIGFVNAEGGHTDQIENLWSHLK
jgi:transposase-like protein